MSGAPSRPPARRLTVLVCDDDTMLRDALCDVLRAEPDLDVVASAGTVDEAITLAALHLPTVAVLDVRMPDGGGPRAAREILRRSPSTGILAFSAYSDIVAIDEMKRVGVTDYLLKGAPNTEITAAVRRTARRQPPR